MKRFLYIALLLSTSIYAQEQKNDSLLNRTVVVEQEYSPLIEDATKINVLPQVEAPSVENRPVEYSMEVMATKQFPYEQMNNYTATEQQPMAKPGYLRLGAGNYGKVDFYGNYLFNLSDNDKLNIQADLNGHNGSFKRYNGPGEWDSYFYRTRAGVEYAHAFNKVTLQAGGHLGVSNFNLTSYSRQRFTSGDVQMGVKSNKPSEKYQYDIRTALLLYQRAHDQMPQKETILRTNADFTIQLTDEAQLVGIATQIDNNFVEKRNYSTIDLNPYYRKQSDNWQLKLGAIIALATNYGEAFYLSPDFRFDYQTSKNSALYLQATGGRRMNGFRELEQCNPYAKITTPYESGFEQLNASIGYKMGSDTGFYMHLFGGYQMLKNELLAVFDNITEDDVYYATFFTYLPDPAFKQYDLNNFYVGADLAYYHKQLFGINASVKYQGWEKKESMEAYCYLLPQLSANIALQLNPINGLQCEAGYQHIGYTKNATIFMPDSYGNLYLKANYTLFNGIGIYACANNLLGNNNQLYVGYPTEKANFIGGITIQF